MFARSTHTQTVMKISALLFFSLVALSTSTKGKKGPSYAAIKQQQFCGKGHFKSSNHTCLPCRSGEFMPEARHTHQECWPCMHCSFQGMHTIKRCSGSSDAQCCPLAGMIVLAEAGQKESSLSCFVGHRDVCCCKAGHSLRGSECVDDNKKDLIDLSVQSKVSKSCRTNQYLDEKTETCRPCQKCTYQNQTEHREKMCKACSTTNPRLAYCPAVCSHMYTNVVLRLVISGLIVVIFPAVLVPVSLAIVSVAKTYNLI